MKTPQGYEAITGYSNKQDNRNAILYKTPAGYSVINEKGKEFRFESGCIADDVANELVFGEALK